jgi:hypothetical protein
VDIGKCWDFKDDEQPPYPVIEVTLSSADRKVTITPKVDTGFNGSVAIDRETVRRLCPPKRRGSGWKHESPNFSRGESQSFVTTVMLGIC